MKVLFLGNSSEVYGKLDPADRRTSRAAQSLEEAFGEPVEMLTRTVWPTPALPATVEKWMGEFQPDMVYLNVISFWFNYESVPLKFERVLGRIGKPLTNAGIKASQTRWPGHTRAFHWVREKSQRVIGGATFFEPEDVIAVVTDCARMAVRHENVVVVVKGPRGSGAYHGVGRSRSRAEERRQRVHAALSRLCEELHVDYVGVERPIHLTNPRGDLLPDKLHRGAEGHEQSGREIAEILRAAWERQCRSPGA